jgi:hypothetical protein
VTEEAPEERKSRVALTNSGEQRSSGSRRWMANDEDEGSRSGKAAGFSGGCRTEGKQMPEVVEKGGGRHGVRRRVSRVWGTGGHGDEKNGKHRGENERAGSKMNATETSALGQNGFRVLFSSKIDIFT